MLIIIFSLNDVLKKIIFNNTFKYIFYFFVNMTITTNQRKYNDLIKAIKSAVKTHCDFLTNERASYYMLLTESRKYKLPVAEVIVGIVKHFDTVIKNIESESEKIIAPLENAKKINRSFDDYVDDLTDWELRFLESFASLSDSYEVSKMLENEHMAIPNGASLEHSYKDTIYLPECSTYNIVKRLGLNREIKGFETHGHLIGLDVNAYNDFKKEIAFELDMLRKTREEKSNRLMNITNKNKKPTARNLTISDIETRASRMRGKKVVNKRKSASHKKICKVNRMVGATVNKNIRKMF